jgi:hypothetical protein
MKAPNGKNPRYRGLLLDFGTVIQKSFFETRRHLEKLLQIPPGSLTWAGPFDPSSDPLWQEVVTGAYPERDYWSERAREVGQFVGEHWTIQDFCLSMANCRRKCCCVRKCSNSLPTSKRTVSSSDERT